MKRRIEKLFRRHNIRAAYLFGSNAEAGRRYVEGDWEKVLIEIWI
jgi:hypothetical protein